MPEGILPQLDSIIVFILTIAWGERYFKLLPLKSERPKSALTIPIGMLPWAVFSLLFLIVLNFPPLTFKVIIWSLSLAALLDFAHAEYNVLADNPKERYIIFRRKR